MKINFWQGLGVAIVVACLVAYYIRTHHKADTPTNLPSTQRAA